MQGALGQIQQFTQGQQGGYEGGHTQGEQTMSEISREQRALIKSEIEDLITEYDFRFDHGMADQMAELFTENAHFRGVAGEARGTAELQKIFTEQAERVGVSRHSTSNLKLEIQDENHAVGTVAVTSYVHLGEGRGKPRPHMVGDFVDKYERGADGEWRFAERHIVIAFSVY